jgi:hypothetical protein
MGLGWASATGSGLEWATALASELVKVWGWE